MFLFFLRLCFLIYFYYFSSFIQLVFQLLIYCSKIFQYLRKVYLHLPSETPAISFNKLSFDRTAIRAIFQYSFIREQRGSMFRKLQHMQLLMIRNRLYFRKKLIFFMISEQIILRKIFLSYIFRGTNKLFF